jgi:phosphate transport system ATP-binding protein
MNDIKITVRNFGFFYGKSKVLEKIDMDITKNAITAIIGPSGCGKSTLLRSFNKMNELIAASSTIEGEVRIDDIDIYQDNVDVVDLRRRIGKGFTGNTQNLSSTVSLRTL